MTILTSFPFSDFFLTLADRDLTEYQIIHTDVVMTARTSGADKGTRLFTHMQRVDLTDKGIRLFNHLLEQTGKSFVQCSAKPWSESMAVSAWLRSMNRQCYGCCNLVYAVCTWKPGRLEQIVDIPVPQIEEEIAEVDRFLHCEKQYLDNFF